jgi:hypothetical protein
MASCGSAGGRDLFYQLTLPGDEVVYIDTYGPRHSNFVPVLSVRQGRCTDTSAELACERATCSDGETQLVLQLAAGDYCLIVDQEDGEVENGHLELRVVRTGRTGTRITTGPSGHAGDTCDNGDQSEPACAGSGAPDAGYYFLFCNQEFNVTASTCMAATFESVVSFREGSALGPDLRCGDQGSCPGPMVQYLHRGPGLFWLIVDGAATGACGPYTLSVDVF